MLKTLSLKIAVGVLLVLGYLAAAHGESSREIDWLELMPAEDLALLESLPEVAHEGDGPVELPDEIMTGRVVPEMEGVEGRIAGYVVPLKTTQDMRILEFFLVPYYGACIHVPPPPPNQLIHIRYRPGFTLGALYEPVWVQGTLLLERTENDIGTASYSMQAEKVWLYE